MTPHHKKVTRRAALTRIAGIGGLAAAAQAGVVPGVNTLGIAQAQQRFRPPDEEVPIKGKAGPGLEPFDKAMLAIMDRHGVPGAALAVAKNGKLLLAKGYGWANVATGDGVEPDTLFGLASLSKSFTATAILLLIDQGKLEIDAPVFELIKHIKPPRGAKVDPRFLDITVRQCLNHSGGWDRNVTGDPINWEPQICRALKLRPPVSSQDFLSFAFAVPLNFPPGTNAVYSNVGYVILGEIIAKISGQSYERFIVENVLKPMGIKRAALHPAEGRYLKGEALRHLAGSLIPLPPMQMPMLDATGGWTCTAVDVARFLANLDGSRGEALLSEKARKLMIEAPPKPLKPRENGTYFGLGWDEVAVNDKGYTYFKDGSIQGMRTFMKRLPSGVNWALLYNASMEFDRLDAQVVGSTIQEVHELVEKFEKYPDIDLFKEYP
jgi:N-acyl-D-amino-acid deacylase